MKLSSVLVSSFLALSTIVAGCSSSTSSGSTPGVFCSASFAGTQVCYGYTNLTSDQQNAVTSSCTGTLQGKIVSSCPTSGLLGCCKTSVSGGYTQEECYYGDDAGTSSASADQMACTSANGTWSTSQ
jgi:hypothetical protein